MAPVSKNQKKNSQSPRSLKWLSTEPKHFEKITQATAMLAFDSYTKQLGLTRPLHRTVYQQQARKRPVRARVMIESKLVGASPHSLLEQAVLFELPFFFFFFRRCIRPSRFLEGAPVDSRLRGKQRSRPLEVEIIPFSTRTSVELALDRLFSSEESLSGGILDSGLKHRKVH